MYMNDGNKTKINLRNKSVFITGVAGFIGSNLAKRLLSTIVLCKSEGGQTMSVKYTTPAQHKSNLRNVYGTFAIEGMTISKDTRSNLDRIGNGQASYQQVVNELRAKYAKKG